MSEEEDAGDDDEAKLLFCLLIALFVAMTVGLICRQTAQIGAILEFSNVQLGHAHSLLQWLSRLAALGLLMCRLLPTSVADAHGSFAQTTLLFGLL